MTVDGIFSAGDFTATDGVIAAISSPGLVTTAKLVSDAVQGLAICTLSQGAELARTVGIGLRTDSGALTIEPDRPVVEQSRVELDDSFTLPVGKARTSRLRANHVVYAINHNAATRLLLEIVVADGGVAHRLRLEAIDANHPTPAVEVLDELSRICLPHGSLGWLQAHDRVGLVTPGYEGWHTDGTAVHELVASDAGWTMPALFKTQDQWLLLAEAGVDSSNGGSHINVAQDGRTFELRRPHSDEGDPAHAATVKASLPMSMPWRIQIVGDLAAVAESNLVRHLSPAADPESDYSWVRPGRVAWTWWGDHDSPRDPAALRSAIDVSSELGWEFILVDANWNLLPEGSVEQLVRYGAKRDVGVMLWYNSGGSNNQMTEEPRDRMTDPDIRRAELTRIARWGVKGIKVDFFHTDKPDGIAQFHGILQDAADVGLMVNFHGCTAPRGWSRTYPNLMTTEAVRGAEWYRLSEDYGPQAPLNNTILALTRNVIGSMDYTPVVLSDLAKRRITTNTHELALAVVFESGLLHFCDTPHHYLAQPDPVRQYLKNVPAVWDESHLLAGLPGSHVVMARRCRSAWFIAAINGQAAPVEENLDLRSLGIDPSLRFDVLADAELPEKQYVHEQVSADMLAQFPLRLGPNGGWVAWSATDVSPPPS